MENIIETAVTVWILAYAIFKMNPVNDPLNPLSSMNPYNHENLIGQEKLKRLMEAEKKAGAKVDEPVIFWHDAWPILQPTIITGLTMAIICLTRWK